MNYTIPNHTFPLSIHIIMGPKHQERLQMQSS